jgi:hypothetical protein
MPKKQSIPYCLKKSIEFFSKLVHVSMYLPKSPELMYHKREKREQKSDDKCFEIIVIPIKNTR